MYVEARGLHGKSSSVGMSLGMGSQRLLGSSRQAACRGIRCPSEAELQVGHHASLAYVRSHAYMVST